MFPTNDGTRDLLPPLAGDPGDILKPEEPFNGVVAAASDLPPPSHSLESRADTNLSPGEQDAGAHDGGFDGSPVTMPINGLAPATAASHFSATLVEDPEAGHFAPVSVVHHASTVKSPATGSQEGDADYDSPEGEQGRASGSDSDGDRSSVSPGGSDPALSEVDDAHGINVTQIAIVDQDASILISGYVGEVVARLHVDQDLMIDQEVDVDITIDGDGQFNLLLDQDLRIDQDVQIDLEIFDVDGVLYVNLFLRDAVEVEQDTTVHMRISEGRFGGVVEVDQDIEIVQDVDIDIDIEDELEERYIVKVGVEALQRADVDQDVVVDIKEWNSEIDVDVDALQTATVDQQTIVQVDFVLV